SYDFDETRRALVQPAFQNGGFVETPLIWRANGGVDWSLGSLSVGVNVQYFGSYYVFNSTDSGFGRDFDIKEQGADHVPAQLYVDLDVSKRLRLRTWGLSLDAN